jgi:hypothetical protein
MSSSLFRKKGPTFEELLQFARTLPYPESQKPRDQWSEDDVLCKSMNMSLQEEIQVDALKIMASKGMVKMVTKMLLKKYINYCSSKNIFDVDMG